MKLKILLLAFLVLKFISVKSQCLNDAYLGFGGLHYDLPLTIITDAGGNAYLTGAFVDSIQLGSFSLSTADSNAVFLAKLSPSGSVLWAKKIMEGFRPALSPVLKINTSNQLLLGGTCENTSAGFDTLTQPFTHGDIYIAGFNTANGMIESFLSMGNHGYSHLLDFETDAGHNLYVTGSFVGPVAFGSFSLVCTGTTNTFVAKFNEAQQALWAMRVTNSLNSGNAGNKIDLDGSSHVYVAGWYGYTCNFGHGIVLNSSSSNNGYLAKFDTSGNLMWVKSSAPGSTYFHQAVVDTANILIVQESPTTLISYNNDGDTLWTKTVSDNSYTLFQEVILKEGHLFAIGRFYNHILLDDSLYSIPGYNIFIAKFSLDGSLDWIRTIHTTNGAFAESFAIDTSRNILLTGIYHAPDTFAFVHALPAFGDNDMFYLKLCNGAVPVNDLPNLPVLNVFPVPFSDILILKGTKANGKLTLFGMTGQEIISKETSEGETKIPAELFPAGLYLLHYTCGELNYTRKVIKY